MGDIFTITPDIREIARKAFSDLITELGKQCRLYYEPVISECSNCYYDEAFKGSNGIYRTGGPTPFSGVICPVCGGAGLQQTEQTELVTLLLNKAPSTYLKIGNISTLPFPNIDMQAKGFITDLAKIKRCKYMVAQISFEPHVQEKYILNGEPTDTSNIVQDKFFISNWKRI